MDFPVRDPSSTLLEFLVDGAARQGNLTNNLPGPSTSSAPEPVPSTSSAPPAGPPPALIPIPVPHPDGEAGQRLQAFIKRHRQEELASLAQQEDEAFRSILLRFNGNNVTAGIALEMLRMQQKRIRETNWAFADSDTRLQLRSLDEAIVVVMCQVILA